ncbi:zinc metalloprotease [Sphingobacterium tabacisoli]|uniref:DUF4843 domain-containing protein n=1 Tax=Sphingobacterium tabacisoli TaxID=2044855 RepID=A0ABW5KZL5_9SPHI|nr:hypothetical protein [Sphingobacterium tabacisoli]
MKRILYVLVLLFVLQGCEKEKFDYQVYQPRASDIDVVEFSTGSPTLIADGKASLQFVLEAFRRVEVKNKAGVTKDTLMFVDYRALPKNEVKVFVEGKLIEGTSYSTTDLSKGTISCYAQIGDAKSETRQVTIRKPKDVGEKRYVDVVFHVFELSGTDAAYDPLTYQEVTPKLLQQGLDYANAIFNNSVGNDPNGGNAQIEFRLARKNASGVNLAIPGYNRIFYDSTWKGTASLFNPSHFTVKINSTASYQWDKDKFLNVYIFPTAANTFLGDTKAAYQIVPAGQEALLGIPKIVNSVADVPTTDFFLNYGLGIHRTAFFPDPSNRVEIASYLAAYYATYPTSSTGNTVVDYVSDTRKYLTGSTQTANISTGLMKVSVDGYKFLANNAMDDIRYASLRNNFTQGQVERLRLVMERSPVRKAWSLQ